MGSPRRANAAKRTSKIVMPTVEEIVAEVRAAKKQRLEGLVKIRDLASEIGIDTSSMARACRRMGVKYVCTDATRAAYITPEDATKLAEATL